MYALTFTYNLTRPYPHKWFAWIVVFGGLGATALFTIINLAANGILYSSNPNQTFIDHTTGVLRQKPWSLASKIIAKCQDQVFSLGSVFYSRTGLYQYTITSIGKTDPEGRSRQSLSFTYHNEPLRCVIAELRIVKTLTADKSSPPVSGEPLIEVKFNAIINCTVVDFDPQILKYFTMALEQSFDPYPRPGWDGFQVNGQEQSFSLWGSRALDIFLELIMYQPQQSAPGSFGNLSSDLRRASWTMQTTFSDWLTAVPHIDIYSVVGEDIAGIDNITHDAWSKTFGPNLLSIYHSSTPEILEHITWVILVMDSLGKIFYSLIGVDLGQVEMSYMFNRSEQIWKLFNSTLNFYPNASQPILPFPGGAAKWYWFNDPSNMSPEALFKWAGIKNPTIHIDPFIDALYLCQVPELKPPGSLAISIIVADLILLQALWTVFTWCTKSILERRDKTANHCPCCAHASKDDEDDTELAALETPLLKNPGNDTSLSQTEAVPLMPPTSSAIKRRPVPAPRISSSRGRSTSTSQAK